MKKTILIVLMGVCCSSIFSQQTSTFTDSRDGKTYKTVKIGKQVWMAENLNFETKDSWFYDNDTSNCRKYGRLYNWNAAKSACPSGWHLPSNKEFETLLNNVGGGGCASYNLLKQSGNSGFSAPLGGLRHTNGVYREIEEVAGFWSSSPGTVENAWFLRFSSFFSGTDMWNHHRTLGLSVRCLKN